MMVSAFFIRKTANKNIEETIYIICIFEEIIPAILVPGEFGLIKSVLPALLATDIYFFAALMSLYFALMKKLEDHKTMMISISIILVIICMLTNALIGFETFTTGNVWLDTVLGLFIRVNHLSFFPFISWCVFPIVGYGISFLFKKIDTKKAVTIAIPLGIGLILLS